MFLNRWDASRWWEVELRFCWLFHDHVSRLALNCTSRFICEWWIQNYLEANGCGLISILSQHLPRGTEENHEKHRWGWSASRSWSETDASPIQVRSVNVFILRRRQHRNHAASEWEDDKYWLERICKEAVVAYLRYLPVWRDWNIPRKTLLMITGVARFEPITSLIQV
jgi:hypothetical protein